ncbi:TetR/AcrR family transcriptional regulator C-terminal domain-containing protein [Actinocorallia aurea]
MRSNVDPPDTGAGAGPVWTRGRARQRRPLCRADIVRAAMEIGDAEGLAAVSIRRIATHLGARAMSLYSHIDKKQDLFELMIDELLAEILIPDGEMPKDWRAAISEIARRERAMMLRHPWAVKLVNQHTTIGPNRLRHLEQSLEALDELGLPAEKAVQIVHHVDAYMVGCAMRELTDLEMFRRYGVTKADAKSAALPYLRELVAEGDFPRLAPLIDRAPHHPDPQERFERGLSWLLDGIEHTFAPRTNKP